MNMKKILNLRSITDAPISTSDDLVVVGAIVVGGTTVVGIATVETS